jgi:predicted transcriptional regulator of viral defense system
MRLTEAHARLLALEQAVLTTADSAACLGLARGHASKLLARLAESGHVVPLRRGLWAFRNRVAALALPQYLTAPFPSYVSLQSALYYHGMIAQIPAVTYAVSVARTRRHITPLGVVSVHHVAPAFFFGFERAGETGVLLATPEKALLDVLYLSPAKTRLFASLPELELPRRFSVRRARALLARIRSPRRRALVGSRLEALLRQCEMAAQ